MALYENRCLIALTISPRPRLGDTTFHYDQDRFLIRKILNRCTDHYLIYPELDKNYRLHYHGVVFIKDKIKWFKSSKKTLEVHFGFIKVEVIPTFERHFGWIQYMRKDWWYCQEILETPILPRRKGYGRRCKRSQA